MPTLRLSDGRTVNVRRVSDIQLATDVDFGGSRQGPVIVDVVAIDGDSITPTRIAVLDHYSIWRSHQAERVPPSIQSPAVVTGMSNAEAIAAAELFQSLSSQAGSAPAAPRTLHHRTWMREVLIGVAVAVLAAIVVALLGL